MWTYIARRLLLMIPTLFGVTIVSFCIMQLAPGDPLLNSLGAGGMSSSSGQTREAYLIQKRDLKLDKPLLLNLRYFYDYRSDMAAAGYFLAPSLTGEALAKDTELLAELKEIAKAAQGQPVGTETRARLAFLQRLKIPQFLEKLEKETRHGALLEEIRGYVTVHTEDLGLNGVTATVKLLEEADRPERQRIGLVLALRNMVVDPFQFAFTQQPRPADEARIVATWKLWWNREQKKFEPVDPDRAVALQKKIVELSSDSRTAWNDAMGEFSRDDMPVFVERLLGDAPFAEKVFAAFTLKQFIAAPIRLSPPLQAGSPLLDEVITNWREHYAQNEAVYAPSFPGRVGRLFSDTQYAHMVVRLLTFNFGRSTMKTREPVIERITNGFIASAPIMFCSQIVIYLVAVPLGILAGAFRRTSIDRGISLALFVLYSVPAFVAAALMLLYLCYGSYLKLFPTMGLHSDGAESMAMLPWLLDYLHHITLPVVCLSLFSLAGTAMYARTSLLDVMGQDYIRTARAKGVSEFWVVTKHAFRNSLIPILTLFSNIVPAMLGGSVLIEVQFNIAGLGRVSWISIDNKDIPTLMAIIYIDAILVMLSILFTDLLYVWADPRISFGKREEG